MHQADSGGRDGGSGAARVNSEHRHRCNTHLLALEELLALLLQHLVFDHLACVALVEASLVLLCGLLFQTQPPVVLHLSFDGGLALQLKLLQSRTWQVVSCAH